MGAGALLLSRGGKFFDADTTEREEPRMDADKRGSGRTNDPFKFEASAAEVKEGRQGAR